MDGMNLYYHKLHTQIQTLIINKKNSLIIDIMDGQSEVDSR